VRRRVRRLRNPENEVAEEEKEVFEKDFGCCIHRKYKEIEMESAMKTFLRYSRYTWGSWFILKVFIKVSTYYALKARDLNTEAYSWITDWGPLVNPFINFILWPFSRVVVFAYSLHSPFWDWIYFQYIVPFYYLYLQDVVEPPLLYVQDISVRIILWVFENLVGMNIGTVIFIFMILYGISDIISYYGKQKVDLLIKEMQLEYQKKKKQSLKFDAEKRCEFVSTKKEKSLALVPANPDGLKVPWNKNDDLLLELLMEFSCGRVPKEEREEHFREQIIKTKKELQREKIIEHLLNLGKKKKVNEEQRPSPQNTIEIRVCWGCGLSKDVLLKCSGCKKARYCGESCYIEDWHRHGEWCKKKQEKRRMRKEVTKVLDNTINQVD